MTQASRGDAARQHRHGDDPPRRPGPRHAAARGRHGHLRHQERRPSHPPLARRSAGLHLLGGTCRDVEDRFSYGVQQLRRRAMLGADVPSENHDGDACCSGRLQPVRERLCACARGPRVVEDKRVHRPISRERPGREPVPVKLMITPFVGGTRLHREPGEAQPVPNQCGQRVLALRPRVLGTVTTWVRGPPLCSATQPRWSRRNSRSRARTFHLAGSDGGSVLYDRRLWWCWPVRGEYEMGTTRSATVPPDRSR